MSCLGCPGSQPMVKASPATLGVPKEHPTVPSLFPWHTFQFDRNHQVAALGGGDGRCNYCTGNQDLPGLLCEQSHNYSGFSASTAPIIPREGPERRQVEMRSDLDWTLVQHSTCTRLIDPTKIKMTITVCLIATTFPGPVLLETIWAPLISMEANVCAH